MTRLVAWAVGFALAMTALRIFVLASSGRRALAVGDAGTLLLGIPEQLLYGAVFALGLLAARGPLRNLLTLIKRYTLYCACIGENLNTSLNKVLFRFI